MKEYKLTVGTVKKIATELGIDIIGESTDVLGKPLQIVKIVECITGESLDHLQGQELIICIEQFLENYKNFFPLPTIQEGYEKVIRYFRQSN